MDGRFELAAGLAGLLNAANAVRPLTRRVPWSLASFFPAWATTEFPRAVVGVQALFTVSRIRRGH